MSLFRQRKIPNGQPLRKDPNGCADCGRSDHVKIFNTILPMTDITIYNPITLCRECGRKRVSGIHYNEDWKKVLGKFWYKFNNKFDKKGN